MERDMILDWVFNIPQQTLTCKIGDKLEYTALEGGTLGYNKVFEGATTHIPADKWDEEKAWISSQYSDVVGTFKKYTDLQAFYPEGNCHELAPWGISPDGRGLDHLQRLQIIMEGYDCAKIVQAPNTYTTFVTPDCGETIFKRVQATDISDTLKAAGPDSIWTMHPQPCLMHPRSTGVELSSYEEMVELKVPADVIERCKSGEWDAPKHPELQKYFVYPK